MKQKHLLTCTLACLIWAVNACEEKGDFGLEEETLFDLFLIDTLSLDISTIFIDSLVTQGSTELLLGQFTDPSLGTINTSSFFQVTLDQTLLLLDEEDTFDSLALVFYPYQSRYGNGGDQVVDLYQVVDDYEPEEDFFYQFDELGRSRAPIASFELEAEEDEEDSVFVKIETRLGQQIYRHAVNGDDAMIFEADFLEFLKGFSFVSNDPSANAIHAIPFLAGNVKLKFFYTVSTEDSRENQVYEFPLAINSQQFNQVQTPDPDSLIEWIKNSGEVHSSLVDTRAFVQGGSALVTRIRLPSVLKLREALENAVINTALLEIVPVRNSFDKDRPLPSQLAVHYINKFDNINNMVQLGDQENTSTGALISDEEFEATTRYEIDVRNFISRMLESDGQSDESLLVAIPPGDGLTDLRTLTIDASRFKTRLRIFISNFKD